MDDAQALFRDGVTALKEARDPARARQLLTQSLKLNPNNDMAWLWLSRTTDDPARQMQCVQKALAINPDSAQARALHAKLTAAMQPPAPVTEPPVPTKRVPAFLVEEAPPQPEPVRDLIPESDYADADRVKTQADTLTLDEERQIARYLAAGDARLAADDDEGAVEQWLYALNIQVDHPIALPKMVRQLHKMKYTEDAQEVLQRAIDAGTPSVSIYLTAIDVNKLLGNFGKIESLRDHVVVMPGADDATVLRVVDGVLAEIQQGRAIELLEKAIARQPSHDLYMKLGEVYEAQGRKSLAMTQFEKGARLATGRNKRTADQSLAAFTPVITDAERGSIPLALREAAGFTAAYLFLAWQDGGLNLLRLTPAHWAGVGLSFVGGYLVVTAFSSAQQRGIAALFGGQVPDAPEGGTFTQQVEVKPWEDHVALPAGPLQDPTHLPILPTWARGTFAVIGIAILALAFTLSFGRSIQLLLNPVTPELPSVFEFIDEEAIEESE